MMTGPLVVSALVGLQVLGGTTVFVQQQQVPELSQGIREVNQGDFESALLTLDKATRGLAPLGRTADLATAYVYLGVAYLGLSQQTLATLKFREAIRLSPELRLRPDEFPARVVRAFEAARVSERRKTALERDVKKSRSKGGLLLLGAGGAVATGLALTIVNERENNPPNATVSVSPEGTAIVGATRVTLTATATDAENDPLSYQWSFGDGASGVGHLVSHTFTQTGQLRVMLTVSDGLATTQVATTIIVVGTLEGTWRPTGEVLMGVTAFPFGPMYNGEFTLRPIFPGGAQSLMGGGLATHPRTLIASYCDPFGPPQWGGGPCVFRLDATVDSALQRITGTVVCQPKENAPCACAGRQQALTLVR